MPLSRFRCPRCDAAVTPWLRPLPTADALCPQSSHTWLLPAEHYLRHDDPHLHPHRSPKLADYPWCLPPLPGRWLEHHPDQQRTIGCCGLSYRGPDLPNLVCPCGEPIGLGYCDCCGPHWYALHRSVRHEQTDDDDPPPDLTAGLAHMQRLCAGPPSPLPAARDRLRTLCHDDTDDWRAALPLTTLDLTCSGGDADPELRLTSPQLPGPLVLPIPRGQLLRLLVLQSVPWGDPDLPMTWQGDRHPAPQVQVSRHADRILLTLWPGQSTAAITMPAAAWSAAWTRLRP